MADKKHVTREDIIKTLTSSLSPLDYVHAFWEGGAPAFGRLDEWSDLDLYVVVDDEKVEEAFKAVESSLGSLAPINQKYPVPQTGFVGISQAFYRLENTNEHLVIDLAVLALSSPDKHLEPSVHGHVVFHFNKGDRIRPPPFEKDAFIEKLQARMDRLRSRMDMFGSFVQKEVNRGNSLEAIDLYRVLALGTLVELLRMKYFPLHYDFGMRYVHHELPPEVVQRLEHLYFVKDMKDLRKKHREAIDWARELMQEIEMNEIEERIRQ